MELFRGLSREVWFEKLRDAGWPPHAAEAMAAFLVSPSPVPDWEDFMKPIIDDFLKEVMPFAKT